MGIARGLCDDNLLSMIKTYVDIYRLSHFPTHSDNAELPGDQQGTLQYLHDSVKAFFDDLRNSDDTLVQSNLMREDFMINKLHAMIHYDE